MECAKHALTQIVKTVTLVLVHVTNAKLPTFTTQQPILVSALALCNIEVIVLLVNANPALIRIASFAQMMLTPVLNVKQTTIFYQGVSVTAVLIIVSVVQQLPAVFNVNLDSIMILPLQHVSAVVHLGIDLKTEFAKHVLILIVMIVLEAQVPVTPVSLDISWTRLPTPVLHHVL